MTNNVVAMRRLIGALSLAAGFSLAGGRSAKSQEADSTARQKLAQSSRAELDSQATALEREAATANEADLQLRKRAEASAIRERLAEGDFRAGDRVVLNVQGDSVLSDTFAVRAGQTLELPNIGEVSLRGVLHSELQDYLTKEIGRFVKAPVVQSSTLLRLAILGSVGKPGFYATSPDILVSDAVMLAGGPTQNSDLSKTIIRRGTDVLWKAKDVQTALTAGLTLDQLNLRAGDEIVVGEKTTKNWVQWAQAAGLIVGIGLTIYGTTRSRR